MSKSKLTDDQWLALFAEERSGVPRRILALKYGVSTSTINQQARTRGLTKRETGRRITANGRRAAGPSTSPCRAAPSA